MARGNGVLGPIETADLGFTLMHEHIMVVNWSLRQAFSHWYDREEHIPHAVSELLAAKASALSWTSRPSTWVAISTSSARSRRKPRCR